MNNKSKILACLKANKLGTLSTANPKTNQPESALVAYVEDNDLNIYFQTSNQSRKYTNLLLNPKVALVVGFDYVTVQYEGCAAELPEKQADIKVLFAKKSSPTTRDYLDNDKHSIFVIKPTWIGYSNYQNHPPEILELKF